MFKKYVLLLSICLSWLGLVKAQVAGTPYMPMTKLNAVTFDFTGAIQSWTVPSGVTKVMVDVMGAQGGPWLTKTGGNGGRVKCYFNVSPGDVLFITVGGTPVSPNFDVPVYGFAGTGGSASFAGSTSAGAGGGLSAVSTASPVTQANAIVIAGGGGGASSFLGGPGGGTSGSRSPGDYGGVIVGGRGGTATAGGAGGTAFDVNSTSPTAGAAITGGNGGIPKTPLTSGWSGGGGGGAGFFGGGGGAGGGGAKGGGGGGSSWTKSTVQAEGLINIGDYNSGNGKVIIYYWK
ncbi:glycine-rich protein [Nubsella zeaxanthinifaciens]|uniref:glycine-rich protein n=1 Tax=Nubsella zeaxanthinifaciens TaxID=392412 RepID=UPI003D058E68